MTHSHTLSQSGLTAACQASTAHAHADVRAAMLAYVKERIPASRTACLAGNTVHADATFLKAEMPEVSYFQSLRRRRDADEFRGFAVDRSLALPHRRRKSSSSSLPLPLANTHTSQVSTIKELVGRWYGNDSRWYGGKGSHRALDDIQGSIEELRHYRETFFVRPPAADK